MHKRLYTMKAATQCLRIFASKAEVKYLSQFESRLRNTFSQVLVALGCQGSYFGVWRFFLREGRPRPYPPGPPRQTQQKDKAPHDFCCGGPVLSSAASQLLLEDTSPAPPPPPTASPFACPRPRCPWLFPCPGRTRALFSLVFTRFRV